MASKKFIHSALIALFLGGLFVIYWSYNPSDSFFFFQCPFKSTTGLSCPGCGSQRAIHHLLHLDLATAFRMNPFMVLSLPLILYGLGVIGWNYLFDTRYRVRIFYSKLFIYGYFGLAILYWVTRNIPYYPFNLMAPTE